MKLQYLRFYLLQNAGIRFPQGPQPQVVQSNHASSQPSTIGNVPNREQASPRHEGVVPQAESQNVSEPR